MKYVFALLLAPTSVAAATPRTAVAAALIDARGRDVRLVRYFYAVDDRELLTLQVNLLSRYPEMVTLRFIADGVLAVDLEETGWDPAVWERLEDPYLLLKTVVVKDKWWDAGATWKAGYYKTRVTELLPNPKLVDAAAYERLKVLTHSRVPIIRADWWFVQSARQLSPKNVDTGTGYYDWLGIKNRNTYFAVSGFSSAQSDRVGRHKRDIVERSGVAQFPRVVVVQQALTGKNVFTLDEDAIDPNNLPTDLVTPDVFKHKAEEHFASLPNGLPYFGLFAANGTRQSTAPDFIGADTSSLRTERDARIHVGLSCIRCHFGSGDEGMRPFAGYFRSLRSKIDFADKRDALQFRRLYRSNIDEELEEVRTGYRRALAKVTQKTWQRTAADYSAYYNKYVHAPVTLADIERESGLKFDLKNVPLSLTPLLEGKSIRREIVEEYFATLVLNYAL